MLCPECKVPMEKYSTWDWEDNFGFYTDYECPKCGFEIVDDVARL